MIVYVASIEYAYEGEQLVGVFRDPDTAKAALAGAGGDDHTVRAVMLDDPEPLTPLPAWIRSGLVEDAEWRVYTT